MKLPRLIFIIAALVSSAIAQTAGVTKSVAPATLNQITGDLVFPAGKTLTVNGTVSGTPAGGTLDLSAVTLTPPSNVVTLTGSQTLTNKTLTSPTLTTPNIGAATGTSLTVTGGITSTGSGRNAVVANGAAGFTSGSFIGNLTLGQSFGVYIQAGSNTSDYALQIYNKDANSLLFNVRGDGAASFSSPVTINSTAASTSTTTGAMVVSGGVGVAGNVNAGGNLTVSGGTIGTAAATNLTLNGGSSGASLVLSSGNANSLLTAKGSTSSAILTLHNSRTTETNIGLAITNAYPNAASRNWAFAINNSAFGDLAILQSNALGGDAFTAGTSALYISPARNLILGTTTDGGQKLQVAGDAALTGNLTVSGATRVSDGTAAAPSLAPSSATTTGFYKYNASALGFSSSGSHSFLFGTDGTIYGANLGSTLSLPAAGGAILTAGGTNQNITLTPSGTGATVISKSETNTNAITTALNYIKIQNTSLGGTYIGALEFYTWDNRRAAGIFANRNNVDGTSGILSFAYSTSVNSFAEGFRLNSTGNLLLGTTTDSGQKLQVAGTAIVSSTAASTSTTTGALVVSGGVGVAGNIYSGGAMIASGTSTSTGYNNNKNVQLEGPSGRAIINHDNGTASGTLFAGFGYNGSGLGSITQDGTSGVLYNTTSDARLKENVRDVTNSGAIIDGLKPRVFDWKKDGDKDRFGFLAQEVHAVFPQAVKKGDDGEEVTDAWAMDAAKLVPVLVAELKALRARVAALEAAQVSKP